MSVLAQIFGDVSWRDLDLRNASGWSDVLGSGLVSTASGQSMTPSKANGLATYYRCKANIAEALALLPLNVYQKKRNGRDEAPSHPAYKLLHSEANPEMTAESFRSVTISQALGWGDGIAEIEFNNGGDPIALWPIHRSRVEVTHNDAGALVYRVHLDDGTKTDIPAERIFHVHGIGGDGLTGWSIARLGAETLGLSLAAQRYGASFFKNAHRPSGTISHPEHAKLGPEEKTKLRKAWAEAYGGTDSVGKVVVLESGGKFEKISIDPDEAQFLATLRDADLTICRWFNMPPHKVGINESAKGWATLEAANTNYVQDTLMIWAVRIEQEAQRKLLGGVESPYYARHQFNALLRGDQKTRAEFYKTMRDTGAYSPNMILEKEDENGIGPDGDKHVVPGGYTTLDKIGEDKAEAPPFGRPPEPPPRPDDDDESDDDKVKRALRPVFVEAARKVVAKRERAFERLAAKDNPHDAMGRFLAKYRPESVAAFAAVCAAVGGDVGSVEDVVDVMDRRAHKAAQARLDSGKWAALDEDAIGAEAQKYGGAVMALIMEGSANAGHSLVA